MEGDKVGDGKRMDPLVLDIAIHKIIAATMSYKQPTRRIEHAAMTLDLFKVTKRRSARPEMSPQELAAKGSGYDEESPEQLTDVCVASIESDQDVEEISSGSNASVEARHEGDDPGDFSAFKILVQVERIVDPYRSVRTRELLIHIGPSLFWSSKTACVNKLLQAAAYVSKKDAFLNLEKGRYEPIFVESWGKDNWRYGVFFLFGVVTVKDGAVSRVSSKVENAAFSKMLEKATDDLRTYLDDSQAGYPDGKYVHGLLFVPQRDLKLPDMRTEGNGDLADTELFFQSLMRIVCGDTVLTWSVDVLQQSLHARKNQMKESRQKFRKRRRIMQ